MTTRMKLICMRLKLGLPEPMLGARASARASADITGTPTIATTLADRQGPQRDVLDLPTRPPTPGIIDRFPILQTAGRLPRWGRFFVGCVRLECSCR